MRHLSLPLVALGLALLVSSAASAQFVQPGVAPLAPPPPAPPPPPKIEVPPVPQMDAPARTPSVRPSGRAMQGSFSDRISRCLEEGAAAGLKGRRREAYSRNCANRD